MEALLLLLVIVLFYLVLDARGRLNEAEKKISALQRDVRNSAQRPASPQVQPAITPTSTITPPQETGPDRSDFQSPAFVIGATALPETTLEPQKTGSEKPATDNRPAENTPPYRPMPAQAATKGNASVRRVARLEIPESTEAEAEQRELSRLYGIPMAGHSGEGQEKPADIPPVVSPAPTAAATPTVSPSSQAAPEDRLTNKETPPSDEAAILPPTITSRRTDLTDSLSSLNTSATQPPRPAPAPKPAPRVKEVTPPPAWLLKAKEWLFGGNLVVKAGLLILFLGVSFLVKYASARVTVPIELRLAGIVAADIGLLLWGWKLRTSRTAIALPIQGGALGILMLTTFAAFRLYDLIPGGLAFALLFLLTAFTCLLAVLQDSIWLAVFGITGGFAAPIATSTGHGSHIGLFSYYALLNAGVLAIALKRSWRLLNVLGFFFTFVISTAWGINRYVPENYASAQAFLVLFFLFYVVIAILFAWRQAPRLTHYVDGTLVFGTPIAASALQYGLVHDSRFGLAFSALALGVFYIGLALALWRRRTDTLRLLVESFLALGIVFGTLAIPFAFDGRWTSAAWALESAGIVWVGLRQKQLRAWGFGLVVQLASWVSFLSSALAMSLPEARQSNLWLGFLLLAISGFVIAASLLAEARRKDERGEALTDQQSFGETTHGEFFSTLAGTFLAFSAAWLLASAWVELYLHPFVLRPIGLVVSALIVAAALATVARRLEWPTARRFGLAVHGLCWMAFLGSILSLLPEEARQAQLWIAFLLLAGASFVVATRLHREPRKTRHFRAAVAAGFLGAASAWLLASAWVEIYLRTFLFRPLLYVVSALVVATLLAVAARQLQWAAARLFGLLVHGLCWLFFVGSVATLVPVEAKEAHLWLGFLLLCLASFIVAIRLHHDSDQPTLPTQGLARLFLAFAGLWALAGAWTEAHLYFGIAQPTLYVVGAMGVAALLGLVARKYTWSDARNFALLPQFAGGLVFLALTNFGTLGLSPYFAGNSLVDSGFVAGLLITVGAVWSGLVFSRATEQPGWNRLPRILLGWAALWWFIETLGGLNTWCVVWLAQHDFITQPGIPPLYPPYLVAIALTTPLFARLARRLAWPDLRSMAIMVWPALAYTLIALLAQHGAFDESAPSWPHWLAAAALWIASEGLLRDALRHGWFPEEKRPLPMRVLHVIRIVGPLLLLRPLVDHFVTGFTGGSASEAEILAETGWFTAGSWARYLPLWCIMAIIALLIPRARASRWPTVPLAKWYSRILIPVMTAWSVALVTLWNLTQNGRMEPLPYLPVLNPLDLTTGFAALLAIAAWRLFREDNPLELPFSPAVVGWVTGYLWFNLMLLRTAAHFLHIPYQFAPLFASQFIQAMLSLVWTGTALVLMRFAAKRRLRFTWMTGAGLLVIVVVKLFAVDQTNVGGIERIISFLGVGALMLAIGYLAPFPTGEAAQENKE